ncbi:hypothetical protein [Burkholderia gladioli]|uniref:Uncharacterized protein n=1 Tax=Burkholderia gladioli TaxID=28095 RepID=A0AB38TT45_BURGA|nr:hypothetical protein [Burkholderia gladioli]MDN7604925.1 hypothetical protein [Burkholderia gladioli]UWX70174.1 hypothetical protein NYZ96_18630 [Burkholderia gladioli]
MADDVDKDIPNDEHVVRGICTPYHYDQKKGKLKRAAFKQKDPTRGVSVYRTLILSPQNCKVRAKALGNPNKQYVGLASVTAGTVRSSAAQVADTRETMFYGHADIFIVTDVDNYQHEAGEPLPPEISDLVDKRIDLILSSTAFYPDPTPDTDDWQGPDLAAA